MGWAGTLSHSACHSVCLARPGRESIGWCRRREGWSRTWIAGGSIGWPSWSRMPVDRAAKRSRSLSAADSPRRLASLPPTKQMPRTGSDGGSAAVVAASDGGIAVTAPTMAATRPRQDRVARKSVVARRPTSPLASAPHPEVCAAPLASAAGIVRQPPRNVAARTAVAHRPVPPPLAPFAAPQVPAKGIVAVPAKRVAAMFASAHPQ